MAREVVTSTVRGHIADSADAVAEAILDHLDSEGIESTSRAARSFMETERDRFHQHMLDAAAEFELEDFEEYADANDDRFEHEAMI